MNAIEYINADRGQFALAVVRMMIALMLLWTFFDNLIGLGYSTPSGEGMIDGGSPSESIMFFEGTFSALFEPLAGSIVTDILLMAAFLFIGGALLLGIGMKITTAVGVFFFALLYLISFPNANNPLLDEHLVYIFALVAIYYYHTEDRYGLGNWWKNLPYVKDYPILW